MNYKDTLNLPVTEFSMRANLAQKEPKVLEKWDKERLYFKILEKHNAQPPYILHDGPPYANGNVHVGTALNKILKDIVVKYKSMKGHYSPYIPGWDCHGLPIEHKVMTDLGPKAKEFSKSHIRGLCEKYARKFIDIQKKEFKAFGVLGDWENPYLTINHSYESAVIDTFLDLVREGFVYKKLKPIHWCMSCCTALAEAELEYANEVSSSIYVNFPVKSDVAEVFGLDKEPENPHFMIWTTTPWTLPANVAVAVNPAYKYTIVKYKKDNKYYNVILADGLIDSVFEKLGITDFERVAGVKGKELEKLEYRHPFIDRVGIAIVADYVRLEDGSGIVHIAPGHGEEDYVSGLAYNLPVLSPVDAEGNFTKEAGKYEGKNVTKADEEICKDLSDEGYLLLKEDIDHSYPHCWRCKKPVIFRATDQWFISVDKNNVREKALDEVKKAKWYPGWGEIRIASMIKERPDWCISRQRAWGVPIPAFYCVDCGKVILDVKILEKVRDIFAEKGANTWFDLDVSEFLPEGFVCDECGSTNLEKEEDIFDVWFESGSSHRAVVMNNDDLTFPADLYLEGTDQHRGWFQLSLLPSIMTQGKAPFKSVVTHGFVVDEGGEKISKSKGGLMQGKDMVKKFSADIIRLWIASVNFSDDIPVSDDIIASKQNYYKKIRNTFRFMIGNLFDFEPEKDSIPYENLLELDKWALDALYRFIEKANYHYDNFEFFRFVQEFQNFCIVEMSSFYFDILKDKLYTFKADSHERRSSQTVLHLILSSLTRMIAPILVFTAEEIWGYVKDSDTESVHLADWPILDEKFNNEEVHARWNKIIKVRYEVAREIERLRKDKVIGNSLEAHICIYTTNEEQYEFLKSFEDLKSIFIISEFELKNEEPPAEALPGIEMKEIAVLGKKSEYKKCERCWNFRREVGEDKNQPELCGRCISAIK